MDSYYFMVLRSGFNGQMSMGRVGDDLFLIGYCFWDIKGFLFGCEQ